MRVIALFEKETVRIRSLVVRHNSPGFFEFTAKRKHKDGEDREVPFELSIIEIKVKVENYDTYLPTITDGVNGKGEVANVICSVIPKSIENLSLTLSLSDTTSKVGFALNAPALSPTETITGDTDHSATYKDFQIIDITGIDGAPEIPDGLYVQV